MGRIEQTFEKQYESIEPEGFLKSINPYRGSLRYVEENFYEKPSKS